MSDDNNGFVKRPNVAPKSAGTMRERLARTAENGLAVSVKNYTATQHIKMLRSHGLRVVHKRADGQLFAWCERIEGEA